LDYVYQRTSKLKRDGYYEYFSKTLEKNYIRNIQFTTPEPERTNKVAELKKLYDASKFNDVIVLVEACLSKDGVEKSDVVHDLLAFLAEQMIEMNKAMQNEVKGFLMWLEMHIGAKSDDLTPRTKIQSYYEYDFDEIHDILKKNKKRLKVDPSRRGPAELLRAEFKASVGRLGPLKDKIWRTDKLIDEIVYRLYGLTKDEIRIIEGDRSS
jgi:hypothetical protein